MDKLKAANRERAAKWQTHQSSYDNAAKVLENEKKKLEQGHMDLQTAKEDMAKKNGGDNVSASDILDINAGGQIVSVRRGTLTKIQGSWLEALFSGRWENQLLKDSKGRIFLDVNPVCFRAVVDYLNECNIAPPDDPPELPKLDSENQVFLDALLIAFGVDEASIDSKILKTVEHTSAVLGFLAADKLGQELTLLYRGSRDGMDVKHFHFHCDQMGPTVTVVKSSDGYTFGGFSDKSWTSSDGRWVPSDKAFLFGLSCHGSNTPRKLEVKPNANAEALFHSHEHGPVFGSGHDLALLGESSCSFLGTSYSQGVSSRNYLAGAVHFQVAEIEVFAVTNATAKTCPLLVQKEALALEDFPEPIRASFQLEQEALQEASIELLQLQDAFRKEQMAIQSFCQVRDDKLILLNVSGHHMTVKESTLSKYPESVLYKQFADPKWNRKRKREGSALSDWGSKEVMSWSKKIEGLSEDVSSKFQDTSGAELLVLGWEGINRLGIERVGTVALVLDAIEKLRNEDDKDSATFLEQSDYCFGKLIDHMRLKALSDLGVPDPNPPEIREPDRKRFQRIVEYYFPKEEEAAIFLA